MRSGGPGCLPAKRWSGPSLSDAGAAGDPAPSGSSIRERSAGRSVEDRYDASAPVNPHRSPVLIDLVASPRPRTAGSPYSRAPMAAWLMIPPISITIRRPRTCRRLGPARGRRRRHQDLPLLEFVELVGIVDNPGRTLGHAGRTWHSGQCAVLLLPLDDASHSRTRSEVTPKNIAVTGSVLPSGTGPGLVALAISAAPRGCRRRDHRRPVLRPPYRRHASAAPEDPKLVQGRAPP